MIYIVYTYSRGLCKSEKHLETRDQNEANTLKKSLQEQGELVFIDYTNETT